MGGIQPVVESCGVGTRGGGIDWSEMTKKQLDSWGLKYHELHFGKPAADFYIDDKMLALSQLCCLFE